MNKNKKGFTLVELIIVTIIVGILSVVSVPVYTNYVRKALTAEGKAFVMAVDSAQSVYYAQNGKFFAVPVSTNVSKELKIDTYKNKYYKTFNIEAFNNVENGTKHKWELTSVGTGLAEGVTLMGFGYDYHETIWRFSDNGKIIENSND